MYTTEFVSKPHEGARSYAFVAICLAGDVESINMAYRLKALNYLVIVDTPDDIESIGADEKLRYENLFVLGIRTSSTGREVKGAWKVNSEAHTMAVFLSKKEYAQGPHDWPSTITVYEGFDRYLDIDRDW